MEVRVGIGQCKQISEKYRRIQVQTFLIETRAPNDECYRPWHTFTNLDSNQTSDWTASAILPYAPLPNLQNSQDNRPENSSLYSLFFLN